MAQGPTERDCEALIAHVVELGVAELRARLPSDQLPTDDELAQVRAERASDTGCRSLTPDELRCALAATTLADVEACKHETR